MSEAREPSRLPVRGTIALAGTVGALTLVLSMRGAPAPVVEPVVANEDEAEASEELVAAAATETAAAKAVTLTGDLVETTWGEVQVAVTLDGSDITDVRSLELPADDDRSAMISDYVGPILREEAISYDTADVSVISGATYTCEAYALSLQSALDRVGSGVSATLEAPVEAPAAEPAEVPAPIVAANEPVTVTGDAVSIRWGDVQVAVTVDGTDIIDVETLAIPLDDRKSQRINESAEPVLREEAIAVDSADVSVISGATYTSQAYAASLQSALDQLGI